MGNFLRKFFPKRTKAKKKYVTVNGEDYLAAYIPLDKAPSSVYVQDMVLYPKIIKDYNEMEYKPIALYYSTTMAHLIFIASTSYQSYCKALMMGGD
jgi:hypothetical protein